MPAAYPPAERARLLAELVTRRAAGDSFDTIAATPGWPSRPTLRKWVRQTRGLTVPAIRRPPVRWSRVLAVEICLRVADGEGLRQLCRDPAMPDRKTLEKWRARRPAFAAELKVARALAGHPHTGRHSTYSPETDDLVYLGVCFEGSVSRACAQPGAPAPRTVRDWVRAHPDFARRLALARQIHWETAVDRRIAARGPTLQQVTAWADEAKAKSRR